MKNLNAWCNLLACLFSGTALAGELGALPVFNPRDCAALETRQTYYGSLLKSGENYAKAAESGLKKGSLVLAATNVIDGYRYAHASRLTWEAEYHQQWIPHVTNSFGPNWLGTERTVLSSILELQKHFAAVERRRNRLLQRLEKLAQDPQLEPLVKGPLAAMQDKLARARTQQQRLALAQELTPAEEGPIRVAPPNGGGPPLTPQQRLEEAIRKGTVEQELQQGPDGLTPPQAARAEAIRKRGGNATQAELEELFRLNKLYPKNEVLHEIKVQLLMARGLSREEAVDYVGKGVLPPPPPGPPAPTPTSTILSDNVPLTPEQKIKLFDKDGKPLLTGYKVQYLAPPGQEIGKIQWEEERLRSFQQGAQANTFVMTEVAGKRVQWALQIKEASRDNLRVTYKLVELERPNAEFTIDEWVMKSAAGQVLQRGTGTVFEVTFPGPGNYVIQATGKTGWGNPFIEEVRVPI